jgi:dTMP kinase
LIAVEGLDGAGKHTFARTLTGVLERNGVTVAVRSFPRYGDDVHADLARDALTGDLGDLSQSVYGMATLFALDRYEARESLLADVATHDVVLLDRYIASNAAYGAARLYQEARGEFVTWVYDLEIGRFKLPPPDVHLLLRAPAKLAAERAKVRARTEAGRTRDRFEIDDDLQRRCASVYEQLAADSWLAPWWVLDSQQDVDLGCLVQDLVR